MISYPLAHGMNERSSSRPPQRPCPACDSQHVRWAFEVDGYPHVRCHGCGTVFVSPLPEAEVITAANVDPEYQHDLWESEDRMRAEARARAQVMQARGCKRVLEIGCGAGFFVEALLELGIEAEGVDPGIQAKRAAARGLPIHNLWLEELAPSAPYDGIAAFELFEHLPQPVEALRWCHRWMQPGAMLFLSTPSASGLPARLLGRRFPMLCPPDHLEVFTRTGLTTLLRRGGFRSIGWESFSNLDRATLSRSLERFALGSSAPGRAIAGAVARVMLRPVQLVDRIGLGTSYEVQAERV